MNMIVTMLVLLAALLSILGVIVSFVRKSQRVESDESGIATRAQLDAAIAMQRAKRIAELQMQVNDRNYWSEALVGVAVIMQGTAFVVDHFSHPSVVAMGALPAAAVVMVSRASRRRYAQRELARYVRNKTSFPIA